MKAFTTLKSVLLWEIASSGVMPWKGSNAREIITFLEQGVRLERPVITSEKMWSLMSSTWAADPQNRPSFDQIVTQALDLAPTEISVVRDHFDGDHAFVRRGQTVYPIRDFPENRLLVQEGFKHVSTCNLL